MFYSFGRSGVIMNIPNWLINNYYNPCYTYSMNHIQYTYITCIIEYYNSYCVATRLMNQLIA